MIRRVRLALGALELCLAGILLTLVVTLPGPRAVREGFAQVERVTASSRQQVESIQGQVGKLRDARLEGFLARLEPQLPELSKRLEAGASGDVVREANQSLGSLANVLEASANALDPGVLQQLSEGTDRMATFLDERLAPVALRSAERLEQSTAALRKDAEALAILLREAAPDLKAAREIHDSLARFSEGLDRVSLLVNAERLRTMREGFKGMEGSLETGADQVERLANYTYPVVKFSGLKPNVEEKPFWPEGERIAEGLRKGSKALQAAGKELDAQASRLPDIQKSLNESQVAVKRTRDVLAKALADQSKLEVVLKSVPQNAARLAEQLPGLTSDLSAILRDVSQVKEVARTLREAHRRMEPSVKNLPRVRQALLDSAERLRGLQDRLDRAMGTPEQYQLALQRTADLTQSAAHVLPLLASRLDRLEQQQQGLADLGSSLGEVENSLPQLGEQTATLLVLLRALLLVASLVILIHGISQLRGDKSTAANAAP